MGGACSTKGGEEYRILVVKPEVTTGKTKT
jgi:hypothetical protein